MSLALLFPGQGSQFVGMGRDLAAAFPEAARLFEEADEIVGFSLSRIAWDGPEDELLETRNAQPAILVHSAAALAVIRESIGPVALAAGHSLGEFSAHAAAGTVSFDDAVRTVRLRGELMYEAGKSRPGTMAAVLGLDEATVEEVCREASTPDAECVPANFNTPGQVVVSGDPAAVERVLEAATESGALRVVPLAVSGAFHSPLMAPAELGLRERLELVTFHSPAFPVVSNVTAEPVQDPALARDLLVKQLTSPVRWSQSVRAMVERGAERFLEVGPGSVLSGLNRRNARGTSCMPVGTPENVESLFAEKSNLGAGP